MNRICMTVPTTSSWTGAIGAALLALWLEGCSLAPGGAQYVAAVDAGFDTAIADIQHFNDRTAFVYTKGMCAITVGAYARMTASDVKRGIGLICGLGDTPASQIDVTAAMRFMLAMEAVRTGKAQDLAPVLLPAPVPEPNGSTIEEKLPCPPGYVCTLAPVPTS